MISNVVLVIFYMYIVDIVEAKRLHTPMFSLSFLQLVFLLAGHFRESSTLSPQRKF